MITPRIPGLDSAGLARLEALAVARDRGVEHEAVFLTWAELDRCGQEQPWP